MALTLQNSSRRADREAAELHVWPDADDADLAGDELSTRSTSGYFLEVAGGEGRTSPIAWSSKKQPATASSTGTAESQSLAEVLSCNLAVQGEALPTQHLMELILGRPVRVVCHEDNEATIAIVRKGYSPKQRAMMRTLKTNMSQLHELITDTEPALNHVIGKSSGAIVLQHHEGITHKGDLFTKSLEPVKFSKDYHRPLKRGR